MGGGIIQRKLTLRWRAIAMITQRQYYLAQARAAIDHVKAKLPLGASNRDENRLQRRAVTKVSEARLDAADLIRQRAIHGNKSVARMAVVYGAGNCGEQAQLAFEYLKGLGVSPIEFFAYEKTTGKDHAWIVIGRPAAAETRWIDRGWRDAVICDPWSNICQAALDDEDVYGSARFERRQRWVRRGAAEASF
jgi:hypothetical protein